MKAGIYSSLHIFWIALLIMHGCSVATADSSTDFVENLFKTADDQSAIVRDQEKNKSTLINKVCAIYGAAIAQVIEKASTDSAHKDQWLAVLRPYLEKRFNTSQPSNDLSSHKDEALALVGSSFEKFSSIPNSLAAVITDILIEIKTKYGSNEELRAIILDAFESYINIMLTEQAKINQIFSAQSMANATRDILTQELQNKTAVESRMIVNLFINKLIEKTNAHASQATAAAQGRQVTDEVIEWFRSYNGGKGATSLPDMSALIQKILNDNYPDQKLFLILTTIRNLLIYAVTPTPIQLPQATEWQPPHHCAWYDLSCSVPWDSIGDALKKPFSQMADKLNSGLKTAFVDYVYDKGIKKIADLVSDSIDKARNMAHTIAGTLRDTADTLSNTPNTIAQKTIDIRGTDDQYHCIPYNGDSAMVECTTYKTVSYQESLALQAKDGCVDALAKDDKGKTITKSSCTKTTCIPVNCTLTLNKDTQMKCATTKTTPLKQQNPPQYCDEKDATKCSAPTILSLANKLKKGAETINNQIAGIRLSIGDVQKQKENLQKQNLTRKGLRELKELNTLLLGDSNGQTGALDDVIAALNELASQDCKETKGILYDLKAAFENASQKAQLDAQDVTNDIAHLDTLINNPSLGHEGIVEALPTRLRNIAKLLDI